MPLTTREPVTTLSVTQCTLLRRASVEAVRHAAAEQSDLVGRVSDPEPALQTVNAPDGRTIKVPGYFKMRSRFVDFAGLYVMHCHILAHEDRGMMTVVQVAPLKAPVEHH